MPSMDTADTQPAPIEPTPAKPLWRRIYEFPLVALFLALLATALVFGLVTGALYTFGPKASEEQAVVVNGVLAAVLSVLLGKYVISHLGEAKRDDFAFSGALRQLGLGLAGSFALMTAIVAVAALLGGYRLSGWGGATSWPMLLFLAGLQAGFFEELVSRGILFRFFEEFGGSWFALALSSAIFGGLHIFNDNATWFSVTAIALEAGILLGGAYMLTRSLWLPVGLHFGWNVTQGFVWDVPVSGNAVDGLVESHPAGTDLISGGAFGLEASLVALVLAGAAGVWLIVLAVRKGEVMRPWWVRRRLAREHEVTPIAA